jgi:hypothetical protein
MRFILGQRVALNPRQTVLHQSRMTRYPDFLLESGCSCFKLVLSLDQQNHEAIFCQGEAVFLIKRRLRED